MLKTRLLVLICLLLSLQYCQPHSALMNEMPKQLIRHCDLSGFTQAITEHEIVEIAQPFLVRSVMGKIVNSINDGVWADTWPVLFEIRAMDERGKIRAVHADKDGNFEIAHVAEGRYCFKATVQGWDSVMGVIIVSRTADPKSRIAFEMKLGT